MWLTRFTNYLLKHRWQSVVLTFGVTFIPIFGILGIIIAGLITLCKGIIEGAIFTLAATLPYVISFYISSQHETVIPIVLWAAVGVAVLSNILTWIFAAMLKKESNWSSIIQIAALMGVLVISIVHLIYPNVIDWWGKELQTYYNQAASVTSVLKTKAATATDGQIEAINITKQYATGVMVAGILFNAIMQLIVARWWQATVFRPGSLRKELHFIKLSQLAGVLFLISLGFSYLRNSVVLDIMPVLYLLFTGAGLSLIHYLFGLMESKTTWIWITLFYFILIFSIPMSIMLVSMLAFFDIWLNFRKRFRTKTL